MRSPTPLSLTFQLATTCLVWLCIAANCVAAEIPDFAPIQAILRETCIDCHNPGMQEGALNLLQFSSPQEAMRQRATWKRLFDVVEAEQMPLTNSGYALEVGQRKQLLDFAAIILSQPDPALGAVNPGKPILRRLTRLEYNNTVRDLFGLQADIFIFPERLPVGDKRYFYQASSELGHVLETTMREYGQKVDVLLPHSGLPGDNRAEYGFANRGDALNFSPLLFEKYLELGSALARSERLFRESRPLQELLGIRPPPAPHAIPQTNSASESVPSNAQFADPQRIGGKAQENDVGLSVFIESLENAIELGIGGVFDIPASLNNQTIAGKGGLIKTNAGSRMLTINPNVDLWLAAFSTANETSGEHLLTNRVKGEKQFELTFGFAEDDKPNIEQLAVCALARKNQSGQVSLTAILSDGQRMTRTADISEQSGNIFFSWVAPPRTSIKRLAVDGSKFSGDYVLLDDFGFIFSGGLSASSNRELPNKQESNRVPPIVAKIVQERSANLPAVEAATVKTLPVRIEQFLTRAYRRPVTPDELADSLRLVEASAVPSEIDASLASSSESIAIKALVQSVLSSPEFLFIAEPVTTAAEKVRRLTDFELANRLSYFLWASMPDEQMLDLAARQQLSQPEILHHQVQRMLQDRPRVRELSESFAAQWLRLDQLYSSKPDRELFKAFYSGPQGKSTLHGPMMTEALLLFETVQVENRSILDLLDPDFTWLNSQLAKLYGLEPDLQSACQQASQKGWLPKEFDPNSQPKVWVRTPLTDRNRGGVLTMAGPLMLTSLPQRTSPVKRGAWLLETIFNRPPSEPKVAFVLEESKDELADLQSSPSIRQRFEKHRSDPNCFSCHSRIDPPGFSLEVFDAIGAFRTRDGSQPVDASGTWNGLSFTDPRGFKDAARIKQQEFIRGFVEHLLSYALGRRIEYYDMPAVDEIVAQSAAQDYRFESIVQSIVASYPFQNVTNVP